MSKLEIHNSKNKNSADNRMTASDVTRRFYTPARETNEAEVAEDLYRDPNHKPKNPEHEQIKSVLKKHGYKRGKGGVYSHPSGNTVHYPIHHSSPEFVTYDHTRSGQQAVSKGSSASYLDSELKRKHPVKEEAPPMNPKTVSLLFNVLKEATQLTLPTTTCDQDGGNHPESKHVKAPGVKMAEDDVPSPDELQKAELGKKTDGKEVLDELGEAKRYTHKVYTGPVLSHDKGFVKKLHSHYPNVKTGTEHVYVHTNHPTDHVLHTLKNKMGVSGFRHNDVQSREHSDYKPDKVAEAKKFKPLVFDQGKEVRAIARERIGQPKTKQVILSKKFKKPKHKPDFTKD